MILGIGIDTVNVHRFKEYQQHTHDMLLKLFSNNEIEYCLNKAKPAEHFASRFAAREAFFKAYQGMLNIYNKEHPATLLSINHNIEVAHHTNGLPYIKVNWPSLLPENIDKPIVHVSMTHTDAIATAMVIIEDNNR